MRKAGIKLIINLMCGLLMLFAVQLILSSNVHAATSGTTSDGYEYEIYSDNTACITGYVGSSVNLVIPESINGAIVTGIGKGAFYHHRIHKVTGNSIKIIGREAFQYCDNLTTVDFPKATEIELEAFCSCSNLTTASFPMVTNIHTRAFYYCTNITTVDFPKATEVGWEAFCSCSNLTTASFPMATYIEEHMFGNCSSLTTVDFPKATEIRQYAFNGCSSLTTVNFPMVTYIMWEAFCSCSNLTTASFPMVTRVGEDAFLNCQSLRTLVLSGILEWVQDHAFGYELKADYSYSFVGGLTLYTPVMAKNAAYVYAKQNNIPVVDVSPTTPDPDQNSDSNSNYDDQIKEANTLWVRGKTVRVKYSKLRKKKQTIARSKALSIYDAEGRVTYKKTKGNKKISINKNTGKITIKKKLKKGKYKVMIKVSAAGNAYYYAGSRTATVTIRVK